jgi:uncharacterized protein YukE
MTDIHVDPAMLSEFSQALARFQDTLEAQMQSLDSEWSHCSQSFLGRQKDMFAENFDSTRQSISQTVEAGRNAAEQLNRYQEAVQQALG